MWWTGQKKSKKKGPPQRNGGRGCPPKKTKTQKRGGKKNGGGFPEVGEAKKATGPRGGLGPVQETSFPAQGEAGIKSTTRAGLEHAKG